MCLVKMIGKPNDCPDKCSSWPDFVHWPQIFWARPERLRVERVTLDRKKAYILCEQINLYYIPYLQYPCVFGNKGGIFLTWSIWIVYPSKKYLWCKSFICFLTLLLFLWTITTCSWWNTEPKSQGKCLASQTTELSTFSKC